MYKNREIFYQNTTIYTIEDFILAFPANKSDNSLISIIPTEKVKIETTLKNTEEIKEIMESILRSEKLVYRFSPITRNYTLKDMLLVQEYLKALDCLETIKYNPYATYARQMLYKYLYSKYNISACNLLFQSRNKMSKIKFSSKEKISSSITLLSFDEMHKEKTPTKSIRKHISDFLSKYTVFYESMNTKCEDIPQTTQNLPKERFCLSLYEVPIFLLLFTFFDRRNFENTASQKSPNGLPRGKLVSNETAYKITFNKAQEIYNVYRTFPLYKSYAWRLDNIFLFHKFNRLLEYYNLYLSKPIIDTIYRHYDFVDKQPGMIQDIIRIIIFEDKDFIMHGLKSDYLDFMLPFDILFQFNISFSDIPASPENFMRTLTNIKERIKKILDVKLYIECDNPALSFSKNGCFSIPDNEKSICDFLEKNHFYRSFYPQHQFLDEFLGDDKKNYTKSLYGFYRFNTLETIIKENIESPQHCPLVFKMSEQKN